MACRRYLISGRVQGVFFRASTQQTADDLGLHGWVRNLPDGRVEAVACGSDEILATLETWLYQGPPMAKVENIDIQTLDQPECHGFEIR